MYRSIPIAPIGAVIIMDKTAMVSMRLPEATPAVSGMAPIAA